MTLRVRLLAALSYVLLLAVIALGVPLAISLRDRVSAEVRTEAQAQADLIAATAADLLGPADRAKLQSLASNAGINLRGRVLIVDSTGAVLADSAGPAQLGSSYESRPELEAALAGHQVQVQRASRTLHQEILATAVPIVGHGRAIGAVRVTQSVAAVNDATRRAELAVLLIGAIVLVMGLVAGGVIAETVARPLRRLQRVAQRVAQGDLSARAGLEGSREQRSLASSFNEMTDRIARLLAAQRSFVADASHQLRTPLTGLRLRLGEARALGRDPAVEVELDAAMQEVDRLAHTIEELLVLSRAGERELVGSRLELGEVAAEAVRRWTPAAGEQQIPLSLERGEPAEGWAARPDVERALDVLIENALAYSPAGAPVLVWSGPGRIEVRDRGRGLSPGEEEAVFERFHRGSAAAGGPPGSGLGLAIARELARGWGGEVWLERRPDGGAVATLTLLDREDALAGAGSLQDE